MIQANVPPRATKLVAGRQRFGQRLSRDKSPRKPIFHPAPRDRIRHPALARQPKNEVSNQHVVYEPSIRGNSVASRKCRSRKRIGGTLSAVNPVAGIVELSQLAHPPDLSAWSPFGNLSNSAATSSCVAGYSDIGRISMPNAGPRLGSQRQRCSQNNRWR